MSVPAALAQMEEYAQMELTHIHVLVQLDMGAPTVIQVGNWLYLLT